MNIQALVPQLRTTDLAGSVAFYTDKLGFDLAFTFGDFYAGVGLGDHLLHLKLVDHADPSIEFVRGEHLHLHIMLDDLELTFAAVQAARVTIVEPITLREWGMKEFVVEDPDGHTIYFAQANV